MTGLSELSRNDLLRALYATEVVGHFGLYLPDGMLALVGQFRNAVIAALNEGTVPPLAPRAESRPLRAGRPEAGQPYHRRGHPVPAVLPVHGHLAGGSPGGLPG